MRFTYPQAVAYLFPRIATIKFGLDTTRALLKVVGHPEQVMPIIHVGGTNGKGSVAALIGGALSRAGWRVGLYTSPHLVSFRERMKVDGVPVSKEAVAMWTEQLQPEMERLGATFFEATTAMAFADLALRGAEITIVEVGLGGRLDSTNVVAPIVSVITQIAADHQKYLGDSLEAIAGEKAWIAKPDTPVIVGEPSRALQEVLHDEALKAVRQADPTAELLWHLVPPDATWEGPLAMIGDHQRRNAAIAHETLRHLPAPYRPHEQAIAEAFSTVEIPGRFQRWGPWVFDVAHNPAGVEALVRTIRASDLPRPIHALVSILGDKDWPVMLTALDQVVDLGVLTVAPSTAERGWSTDWLHRWLAREDRPPARARWKLVEDFPQAIARARAEAGTVVVTGSFHTVGDVQVVLGIADVVDHELISR